MKIKKFNKAIFLFLALILIFSQASFTVIALDKTADNTPAEVQLDQDGCCCELCESGLIPINPGVNLTTAIQATELQPMLAAGCGGGTPTHVHDSSCYTAVNVLRPCFNMGATCNQGYVGCGGGNYNHGWVDTWMQLTCTK